MQEFTDYHAHIYFDQDTFEQAKNLISKVSEVGDMKIGKMHEKPVGPHPTWSCQLSFTQEMFSSLTNWLMRHRNGLTVLVHPLTGDDKLDHIDYALWMGEVLELKI
jgi:DOPA 4,5-dioxygenase